VNERNRDLLRFYQKHRITDQLKFYTARQELFERATGQGLALSATLLGFTSAAGALAGASLGWGPLWTTLAVIFPAISTALAAYVALYAFEQQSKIYGDAVRAVRAAARVIPPPDVVSGGQQPEANIADLVQRVEGVMRREQGQWGQLTAQIQVSDQTGGDRAV
jgi:SMODS and SLOG-associating 2TM effector domain 1